MRRHVFACGLLLAPWLACTSKPDAEPTHPPSPTAVVSATLAFEDVRMFDGETFVPRATVLVDGDRIVAVGPDLPIPEGAERVHVDDATLLPGLIDAHTHVQSPDQLAQALVFGVTTEIDMFTVPALSTSLREEEGTDRAKGRADLRSAGTLVTAPGGHGTEYGIPIPTLERPEDAAAFVDARLAEGSDFIKIVYDDGSGFGLTMPTLDRETVQAVIEAAHARDVLAVVHVSSQHEAIEALRAGADGLAHLVLDEGPSDAFVAAFTERKAFVTDTLTVLSSICDGTRAPALADDEHVRPYLAPEARRMLLGTFPIEPKPSCEPAMAAVARLHEAGIRLLASTDVPNPGTTHGASLHDELALLVAAGLPPAAALRAATADPADVFALPDRGRIAPGSRADLVLVAGDPGQDITRTRRIVGVWKQGARLDRDAAAERVAEQWAQLERAKQAPPPAGMAAGLISDFESGQLRSEFGAGWQPSTDAMIGGRSTVALEVVDGALQIVGTIAEGSAVTWAGGMFYPGDRAMMPANLTSKPTLSFQARGDGPLTVMIFATQMGMTPATTQVEIGAEWAEHRVDLRTLVAEPYDVSGIFFGGPSRAGAFTVELDDVRLR